MTNEELTVLLLDKVGWEYDKLLNPGHYKNTKDLLAGELILAIFSTASTPDAATLIGSSYKSIITALKRFFNPQFGELNGGGESWKFRLQHELQLKECSGCRNILPYTEFHLDNYNSRGINYSCKKCRVAENAATYKKPSTKEAHKRSYIKNKDKIRARNALYRAQRELRCPSWADKTEIALIYKNCPEDLHIDHIIPLKGDLVSGLHVSENLQYLSPEDNIRKSNSFDLDKYNSNQLWYNLNSPALQVREKLNNSRLKVKKYTLSLIPCLYCGKEFKPSKYEQSYCSKSCAGKHLNPTTESTSGYTKDFIESLIWELPFTRGAKEVGLSDNGLRKMAIRMGCTMPPERFHVKSEELKKKIKQEQGIKEYIPL